MAACSAPAFDADHQPPQSAVLGMHRIENGPW
jgi:hypothetical protein